MKSDSGSATSTVRSTPPVKERMDVASAIRHLRSRLAQADVAESRNRPKWTGADMAATAALVDIPASAEQIALARIEGRSSKGTLYTDDVRVIHAIARQALGLAVTK